VRSLPSYTKIACPGQALLIATGTALAVLSGCSRSSSEFTGPPVTATAPQPASYRQEQPAALSDVQSERTQRVSFSRSALEMPAQAGAGSLPAAGTLTFSASKLSPGELLRIVAAAMNMTPVMLNPVPDTPEVNVPAHMSIDQALSLLNNVLASVGQELSFGDGVIYVRNGSGVGDIRLSRNTVRAIRLNFIDNQTFASLASSLIPSDRLVLPKDPSLVIYVGPSQGSGTLDTLRQLVDTFDLRGTVATLVPLRRANAVDVARQVSEAIGGGSSGLPRIIPLPQRRALLVVAPRTFDISNVEQLVRTLDRGQLDEASPIRIYTPQHRTAADLLALLRSFGGAGGAGGASAPPRSPTIALPHMPSGPAGNGSGTTIPPASAGPADLPGSPSPSGDAQTASADRAATPAAPAKPLVNPLLGELPGQDPASAQPGAAATTAAPSEIATLLASTTVDLQTNRILFSGTASEFVLLRRALHALDFNGGQIMIEAVIMQVVLNDQLQYGVQYALSNAHIFGTPVSATTNTGLPTDTGLVFSIGPSSAQVIISALDLVTNVTVISSPKIMVVSGEAAQFHFGASVPVLSATLSTSTGQGAALANQVEYRDTGVSLQVTPSVIDNTMTDLNIQQVLSNLSNTVVSGVSSPVFDDRQIKTHVRLRFGDTIMLGGIIEHDRNDTDTGIPVLRRIPLLGSLFGTTARTGARSEYVLLLTPRLYLDNDGGPKLQDARSLRFERLAHLWDTLHYDEAFPTAATSRTRLLKGP